jgi:hypothetical protein
VGLLAALLTTFEGFNVFLNTVFSPMFESGTVQQYIFIFGSSMIASIVTAYATAPAPMDVLKKFYLKTKPFGLWWPVRLECDPKVVEETMRESGRDILLLFPAMTAHFTLFLGMSSIMFKQWRTVGICFGIFAFCALVLYKYWYKNLKTEPSAPAGNDSEPIPVAEPEKESA